MRILLIATSYNGLCQRAHIELEELGHQVSLSLSVNEDKMRGAVLLFQPGIDYLPIPKRESARGHLARAYMHNHPPRNKR